MRQVERTVGRPVAIAPSIDGLLYRGRLVGYARDDDQQRYAVVDTGPELIAVRTEHAELTPGQKVRAAAREVEEDRRHRLIWRLDDERQQQRERGL